MTINKFQGKTQEEAVAKAKQEMGPDMVVMSVRLIKPKGMFKMFKDAIYEVTAAVEEQDQMQRAFAGTKSTISIRDNINFAADENIKVPVAPQQEMNTMATVKQTYEPENIRETNRQADVLKRESQYMQMNAKRADNMDNNGLEERIENLQSFLEKQLGPEEKNKQEPVAKRIEKETKEQSEGFKFLKMIYGIMLENEVNEKYANAILEDIEKVVRNGSSVDYILSSIYQKMILKFGQPKTIELTEKKPKVVFFIGPTGVGKTTTIAKIASKFCVDDGKSVAFLTADTYRIAAAEQLKTYANILDADFSIVYSPEEINDAIAKVSDCDLVLVDTAGFSHKSVEQRDDIKKLIDSVDKKYQKEVYLVVSATTKYKDLKNIADVYHSISDYQIIFTKLDETSAYGNMLNIRMYSGADLSYTTNGQNVPDDIEVFNTQKIVKQLLGGK